MCSKRLGLTSLVRAVSDVARMINQLREAVEANPNDAQAFKVLVDALLEVGDPRGELLRRSVDDLAPRVASVEERILAGRLATAADELTIWRGLLWGVQLKRPTPTQFRRLMTRPEWRTVRRLHFLRGRTEPTQRLPVTETVALLCRDALANVREVSALGAELVLALGTQPKTLSIESLIFDSDEGAAFPEVALSALPKLARLTLAGSQQVNALGHLVQSETFMTLTALRLEHFASARDLFDHVLPVSGSLCRFSMPNVEAIRTGQLWALEVLGDVDVARQLFTAQVILAERVDAVHLKTYDVDGEAAALLTHAAGRHGWKLTIEEFGAPPDADDLPF